jgi:hypothetical protein
MLAQIYNANLKSTICNLKSHQHFAIAELPQALHPPAAE